MTTAKLLSEAVTQTGGADISDVTTEISSDMFTNGNFFKTVADWFIAYLPTLIAAVIILIVGLLISKLILFLMKKGMNKSFVDKTVSSFTYSLVKILLYVLIITMVLTVLGVPMSSIIAVIGTCGVAIGLALKDSLSNIAGGFTVLLTKPFRIGDYVKVGSDEGTIEVMNIWYTQLLTGDNKTVFIPNGQLSSSTVTNYTRTGTRRVDMVFQIGYSADFDKAIAILTDITSKHELILNEPETLIKMAAQSESSIDIAVRPWVKSDNYWTVYFDLNEAVKKAFDENGIEIPFKQIDVHINQ